MAVLIADPNEGRRKLADPALPKAPPPTNPSPLAQSILGRQAALTAPGAAQRNPAATAALTRGAAPPTTPIIPQGTAVANTPLQQQMMQRAAMEEAAQRAQAGTLQGPLLDQQRARMLRGLGTAIR